MANTNPQIAYLRILKSYIEISPNIPQSFNINAQFRTQTRIPDDKECKKAILETELSLFNEDDSFKINLEVESFLKFDKVPEDYDKEIEKNCISMVQKKIFNILDEILVNMGYERLNLEKQN